MWNERAFILFICAVLLSIICVIISEAKIVNRLCLKLNNKTIHENIWADVIEYKRGTTLRLITENAIYTGVLTYHEEKGNDSWFVLKDYIIEEDNKIYKAEKILFDTRIAINIKDVKRVELYYGKKTSMLTRVINWVVEK